MPNNLQEYLALLLVNGGCACGKRGSGHTFRNMWYIIILDFSNDWKIHIVYKSLEILVEKYQYDQQVLDSKF